MFELEQTLL